VFGEFEIKRQCGEPYPVSLQHDGLARESLIYIPKILCDDEKLSNFQNEALSKQERIMTLPVLVSIHCFGGDPNTRMAHWRSFAEEFTFILMAPRGLGRRRSWNADQCCGHALESKLDDIGFIQRAINETIHSFSTVFPTVTLSDGDDGGYLWISGFSNGGFMADKIAWQSSMGRFSKIVAAAPMAGYIYDRSRYIEGDGGDHQSVAMYLHHKATDTMVHPEGCCIDKSPKCCCGISEHSRQCVSVQQQFEHWMKWNRCRDGVKFDDLKRDRIIEDQSKGTSVHVQCADATPKEHGCDRMTSLCLHGDNSHHSQWARYMPQRREVMAFFLKSLCLQQLGAFNEKTLKCECAEGSEFEGPFCISLKGNESGEGAGSAEEEGPWLSVLIVSIIVGSIVLFMVKRNETHHGINISQYTNLRMDDEDESTEEMVALSK